MATRGRPPGQGKVPGSGRKRGGLDKSARLLITETMAADILKVYKRLGKDWLFEVAKTRPDLFINQCLSRLLPPAFKDGADVELYQQFNIDTMSDLEAGRRVAFALAKAAHDQGIDTTPVETIEVTPQQACSWQNPTPPYTQHPEAPVDDPARQQWASELSLTPQERADNTLIRETRECTLANYRGGPGEQGGYAPDRSPASTRKPTVAEIRRKQLL